MPPSSNPKRVSEMTDAEAIEDFIALLRKCPNPDERTLFENDGYGTVSEMIDHLEKRTPIGIEILEMHQSIQIEKETEKGDDQKLIQTIKGAIEGLNL